MPHPNVVLFDVRVGFHVRRPLGILTLFWRGSAFSRVVETHEMACFWVAQRFKRCGKLLGLDWALAPEGTISTAVPTATTPQDFLKALRGELKITANFSEATVEITQFEDVKKAAQGKD